MDPDVRSSQPGFCPRCAMKLVAGLPEPIEYHMDLTVTPRLLRAGQKVKLGFTVLDPWKGRPVTRFQAIHERLFHMFVENSAASAGGRSFAKVTEPGPRNLLQNNLTGGVFGRDAPGITLA